MDVSCQIEELRLQCVSCLSISTTQGDNVRTEVDFTTNHIKCDKKNAAVSASTMAELPEIAPNCAKNSADVNCFDRVEECVNDVTKCDTLVESESATLLGKTNARFTDCRDVAEASKYFKMPIIKITLENDAYSAKPVEFVSKYFKHERESHQVVQEVEEECVFVNDDGTEVRSNEYGPPLGMIDESSQESDRSQISEEEDNDRDLRLSQLNNFSDEIIVENFFNMSPRKMPVSPHRIIEEEFRNNPWVMLVATIFLTKTAGSAARPFMKRFFAEFPTPYAVLDSDPSSLEIYFETLGMRKRAAMIWKMSHQFVSARWRRASDLYGIGKYGEDAYRLFCLGHIDVEPSDRYLRLYLDWLTSQTDHGEFWGVSDCEGIIFDPVAKYYAMSLR